MKKRKQEADHGAVLCFAVALRAYASDFAPRHVGLRRAAMWGGLACVLLVLAWVGGIRYGMNYDLQGTRLSVRTTDVQFEELIQERAEAYRLHVVQPDGYQQAFSLENLGMRIDMDETIAAIRRERYEPRSLLQWWRPVPIALVVRADPKALKSFVDHYATIEVKPAQNATLSITDGSVRLTKDVAGKKYGFDNPSTTILRAASRLQTEPLHLKIVDVPAEITTESLAAVKTQLDNVLRQPVVITVGTQQVRPTSRDIAAWLTLKPVPSHRTVKVGIDNSRLQAYFDQIAARNNLPPRARVLLGGGRTVPGVPGVAVVNTTTARTKLVQELLKGRGLEVELETVSTPFTTVSAPTAGKWIEVDLTHKRLYAYDQTNLIRTFLVSAGAPATPTVTGTFAIYTKYVKQTMSGPNADGSSYVQPDVPWVNYFYSDFAIHGNYWRPIGYFGYVHSSHGCVGLLPDDAAWVYTWAPIGTPVLIHW